MRGYPATTCKFPSVRNCKVCLTSARTETTPPSLKAGPSTPSASAKEIGFYQDVYSDYGRLENEMWRAIRLVVDTGVHEKHWSREQMVDFFHRYTAMDEPNVQSEVDRYIAWPGQALAYKLGQLEILKLRDEARQRLGNKFDIRFFHDEVLGNGALPLDVLEKRIRDWVAKQKLSSAPTKTSAHSLKHDTRQSGTN